MSPCRDKIRSIMIATNKIDGVYYLLSRHLGLKANTLALLYALDDGKSHSQKQICQEWLMPKTTLNTVVRECVENGYVTLVSEEHTREKVVRLTPKGKTYANRVLGSVYQAEENAMQQTLKEYSENFIPALEAFANYLSEESEHKFEKIER